MLAALHYGNFCGLEVLKEAQQGGPGQLLDSMNRIKQTECKFMCTESVSKVLPVQISKRDHSCEERFASAAVICLTVLSRPPIFPAETACLDLKSAISPVVIITLIAVTRNSRQVSLDRGTTR